MKMIFFPSDYNTQVWQIQGIRYLLINNLQNQMKLILLVLLVVAANTVDYCEQTTDSVNYFITPDEMRVFPLGSYIKGHDLEFTVDSPQAKLYSSYSIAQKQYLKLQGYSGYKSVDVKKSAKSNGMGYGAILAQRDDDQEIAVWLGKFQGYNKLPDISQIKFLPIPGGLKANCFDLRVANEEGSWAALNCQTIPQNEGQVPQDMLCYILTDAPELSLTKNCKLKPSLLTSRDRRSSIYIASSGQTYLLSANKDFTKSKASISYISVYYFNSKMQFVFSNIIDGTSLPNPNLQISDFLVTNDNTIVVADSLSSRLIFYKYSVSNVVSVAAVINYPGRPLALAFNSAVKTLVVATKDGINEHDYSNPAKIVKQYEVDSSDSLITSLQTSKSLVAFTTQNKNLYIYERQQSKINYLLTKLEFTNQIYLLSQQNSYVFSFAQDKVQSAFASQPVIQFSKVTQDQKVQIIGKSTTQTCSLTLNLKYSTDRDAIVNKQNLEGKSFKVDPITGLQIALDSYFGGSDLEYKVQNSLTTNTDFIFEIKHMNQYTILPSFQPAEATTVLAIDSNSFYYIGVNSIKNFDVYVDICKLQKSKVVCEPFSKTQSISKTKKSIEAIKAYRRSNGVGIVMWSFKYSGRAEWIYIQKKVHGYTDHSYPLAYSSIQITDKYFMLVSKTGRFISILFEEMPFYTGISESSFKPEQLVQVQYFYPRNIYIDRSNPNIFYVKLLTSIAKFHILDNHEVQYLGIVRSYDSYKLDSEWSISFDSLNVLTQRDNAITEQYYNGAKTDFVKTQGLQYKIDSEGIQYDSQSKISYIVSKNSNSGQRTVKIMKPFQGAVDFEYSDIVVDGDVSLSGNWLVVNSETPLVYFVDSHPTLKVQSNLPEDAFKQDLNVKIEIKSKTQTQVSVTQIEGVNYPVTIKNNDNKTVVHLPSSANSKQIPLPIEKYFSGPVSYYSLSCPMCGGTRIHLNKPMIRNKNINDLPGVYDFVKVGNRIVAVTYDRLALMNNETEIITQSPIDKKTCTNLEYTQQTGLLVFCTSQTGEQILKYTINKDKFFFDSLLVFHADNNIRNFDQMFAIHRNDKDYLFILDNDESVDSNNKRSTIKAYQITDDLVFLGEWTSKTFGIAQIYPINDLQIWNNLVFVTIGNYGIGYATLNDDLSLSSVGNLQLATIPDVKDALLLDSYFKQIDVLSYSENEAKVFLTTTNSLSMVVLLSITDKVLSFKQLKQSYYRYGNQRLLNWHAITNDAVYLSYYNERDDLINLVYYRRTEGGRTNFVDGVLIRTTKAQLKYHEAFLINKKIIVSHLSNDPNEGQLTVYDLYSTFNLWVSYEQGGDFDFIEIIAFNDYKSASHIQPVKFEAKPIPPKPEPEGLKWYIVLIICLSILIAVGAAYGMYMYMKKKRAEKSVSLLTERQQDGEDEKDENLNESTSKDINRSSINAVDD